VTTLLDRTRLVATEAAGTTDIVEKRMFGGTGVMIRGKLALSVGKDGALLVRVDVARSPQLQTRAGVQQGEMGGRTMGPGWLVVDGQTVADDVELRFWVDEALVYNALLTAGG